MLWFFLLACVCMCMCLSVWMSVFVYVCVYVCRWDADGSCYSWAFPERFMLVISALSTFIKIKSVYNNFSTQFLLFPLFSLHSLLSLLSLFSKVTVQWHAKENSVFRATLMILATNWESDLLGSFPSSPTMWF